MAAEAEGVVEGEADSKAWKWRIRKRVWDLMEAENIARNPRPVHHRIPNFAGAADAGDLSLNFGTLLLGDSYGARLVIGYEQGREVVEQQHSSGVNLGELVYEPPRDGPTLWEIGVPDRSAAEFYVPNPDPKFVNRLYVNHPDKFRQYGLWERYAEVHPDADLVYTVGVSDYKKDWFFAQVTRKNDQKKKEDEIISYRGTTWQIKYKLDNVDQKGPYKLRLAIASASQAEVQVRFNDPSVIPPHFSTGQIGRDNAIARHGIHGLYWLFMRTWFPTAGSSYRTRIWLTGSDWVPI